jgi:hypothetical protein
MLDRKSLIMDRRSSQMKIPGVNEDSDDKKDEIRQGERNSRR